MFRAAKKVSRVPNCPSPFLQGNRSTRRAGTDNVLMHASDQENLPESY
jgi:hypothetical protein